MCPEALSNSCKKEIIKDCIKIQVLACAGDSLPLMEGERALELELIDNLLHHTRPLEGFTQRQSDS